jgi:hypothetical protein
MKYPESQGPYLQAQGQMFGPFEVGRVVHATSECCSGIIPSSMEIMSCRGIHVRQSYPSGQVGSSGQIDGRI